MAKLKSPYTSHDFNISDDEKIMKLRIKHGIAGYGAYMMLLEMLYEMPDGCLEYDLDALAFDIRANKKLIKSVIESTDLFAIEDGIFYSPALKSKMDKEGK